MERIDHIALPVADISAALDWYREHFTCETLYVDESWALLGFENISLALVLPDQHPPHFAVTRADAESHGTVTPHRDGTASVYTRDPWNNAIEIMKSDARA
ncbi:MAG: glyoxalase [Alphaproteobacteria bacterium]|nr:glyoxalase [Alphaproteobacteria bacterium]|tara:strand:+ start:2575 stop:2877 length:303 start_codon:yes stop_codon:yes gene_type:complete